MENRHDMWKPDKFFKTLLPLIRLVEENKTPAFLFMDFAKKVVYDCRDDGSGDFQFRIDIKRQLSLARVLSDMDLETRETFSANQRRTMFKGLLDNAGDEAGVKRKGDQRVRTKVVENLRNLLQAQNDSELFLLREFLDYFVNEAAMVRLAFRNVGPAFESELSTLRAQLKDALANKKPTFNKDKAKAEKDRIATP